MNTVHAEMIGKHDRTAGCQCDSCGSLTFAEAMALDPSEVEAEFQDGIAARAWVSSDTWQHWSYLSLRTKAKFRRSRPKRSRVQEMAEERFPPGRDKAQDLNRACAEGDYTYAIRAVCEYVDTLSTGDRDGAHIEREFLEPR